jgi:hypothetical protein
LAAASLGGNEGSVIETVRGEGYRMGLKKMPVQPSEYLSNAALAGA